MKPNPMQIKKAMQLYLVTDSAFEGKFTLKEQVEQALKGGATLVQLREKELPEKDFIKKAGKIKEVCDKYNVPLIINDNLKVALAVDADGLHIGQEDMSSKEARKQLGPNKILGVSASTVQEALLAQGQGADYLGIGAVHPTDTKTDAGVVLLKTIKDITSQISIASCAIGGIKLHNVSELIDTGIDGVAVVSAILGAEDMQEAAAQLFSATEVFQK